MKTSDYKNQRKSPLAAGAAALILAFLLTALPCAAQPVSGQEGGKLHIEADKLVGGKTKQYATFSGNVRASYSGSTLTSDTLHIYYAGKKEDQKAAGKKQSFEKIVAMGNVKVTFDGQVATADQVVYTAKDDTIVLSGGSPRISTDDSFLTGKVIKVRRTDGQITIISDKKRRVEALFYPEDEAFKQKKGKEE